MKRRTFLGCACLAGVGALAGCTSSGSSTKTDTVTPMQTPPAVPNDVELPVPSSELNRGAPKDAIPAIVDPAFGPDWTDVEVDSYDIFEGTNEKVALSLNEVDRVIGVERDGEARAYPIRVLNWHEIVNDTFSGPLLVTFCPLCGSGLTAERTVDGTETIFGVSGFLWNSDLVMYDEKTESLWSQILATAIRGEKTGDILQLVPSSLTTWGTWLESHPDSSVLLPPPFSSTVSGKNATRNYGRNPYGSYGSSRQIGIGFNDDANDERLHPKAIVIGVTEGDVSRAYPLQTVTAADVINDTVGGRPVVVSVVSDSTLVAYDRTVAGSVLEFANDDPTHMSAGGSRWRKATGVAVDGPHEGTQLTQANTATQMFWFAWADFRKNTEIYGE